jgi:prophage regulatory protein
MESAHMLTNPIKILRQPEVAEMLSISDQTLDRWVRAKQFPAPLKLGPRAKGWLVADIESFIEAKRGEALVQSVAA